jgi:hypothetical protein
VADNPTVWLVRGRQRRDTSGLWGGAVELVMPEPTVRERILQALEDLPPEATFDDAIERLVFLAKIERLGGTGRGQRDSPRRG